MPEFVLDVSVEPDELKKVRDTFVGLEHAINYAQWDIGNTLRNLVFGRTPGGVRKKKEGIPHIKDTWSEVFSVSEDSVAFGTGAGYATVLESGGYPGVGPRTVSHAGQIYSRQALGGMVRPVLDDKQDLEDIVDDVIERIREAVTHA